MEEAPQKGAAKGQHAVPIAPTNYAETMDVEECAESALPISLVPPGGHVPLHQKGRLAEAMTFRPLTPMRWQPGLAVLPSFRWRKVDANMDKVLRPCSCWDSFSWLSVGGVRRLLNNHIGQVH